MPVGRSARVIDLGGLPATQRELLHGYGLVPGRVLRVKFLGDQAVLEVAAEGFERPLTTLVHDGAEPLQGTEVGLAVDPESVLVFPEGTAAKA